MNYAMLLPEFILTGLGVLLIILDISIGKPHKRLLSVVGLVGVVAAIAAVVPTLGQTQDVAGQMIRIDNFAGFFKLVFLTLLGLIFLFAPEYVQQREMPAGEFYVLLTFATLGAILMAGSLDLLTIYVGLELLSISSYVLTGLLRKDERSSEAAVKYFLIGAMTSAIVLFGISLVYGLTGTTNLVAAAQVVAGSANPAASPAAGGIAAAALGGGRVAILAAALFFVAGLGVKIAAVPFHMWAPDAYDGAPTPVSAFLITVSEAAAFAAILRIFLVGLPVLADMWQPAFAVIAVVTMTYGNITAIAQSRMKRMLAYSAIAQAGYVLVGVAAASAWSLSAMLYYLLAYAFMTAGTFAVVVMVGRYHASEEIADYRGLAQRSPAAALALTLFLLSFIGVPPLAGFFGKLILIRAAIDSRLLWLAVVMMINSVISVPYYFGVVRNMYLAPAQDAEPVRADFGLHLALGLSVIAVLALGIFPEQFLQLINLVAVGP